MACSSGVLVLNRLSTSMRQANGVRPTRSNDDRCIAGEYRAPLNRCQPDLPLNRGSRARHEPAAQGTGAAGGLISLMPAEAVSAFRSVGAAVISPPLRPRILLPRRLRCRAEQRFHAALGSRGRSVHPARSTVRASVTVPDSYPASVHRYARCRNQHGCQTAIPRHRTGITPTA